MKIKNYTIIWYFNFRNKLFAKITCATELHNGKPQRVSYKLYYEIQIYEVSKLVPNFPKNNLLTLQSESIILFSLYGTYLKSEERNPMRKKIDITKLT